jgi:hypothetical protein
MTAPQLASLCHVQENVVEVLVVDSGFVFHSRTEQRLKRDNHDDFQRNSMASKFVISSHAQDRNGSRYPGRITLIPQVGRFGCEIVASAQLAARDCAIRERKGLVSPDSLFKRSNCTFGFPPKSMVSKL